MTEGTKPTNEFTSTDWVVALYPHVLEPSQYEDPVTKKKGKLEYSSQFLLKPDAPDFLALKTAVIDAIKAKWPGLDFATAYKNGELKLPWVMGDKKIEKTKAKLAAKAKEYTGNADFMAGMVVVKAHTEKFAPSCAVQQGGKNIDINDGNKALMKNKFYSGVLAAFSVKISAYDGVGDDGKPGVTLYLQSFLSSGKGKQIGGRVASQVFGGFAGKASPEDPTAGAAKDELDDEIPF